MKGGLVCVMILTALVVRGYAVEYIAAVVEFQPAISPSPSRTIEDNVHEYVAFIESAKREAANIIVFPEYGLTGMVLSQLENYSIEIPDVGSGPTFNDINLHRLANAAREHGMFVVANVLEKSRGAANKTIFYNTNFVLNLEGKIVAKYRKINLFAEPLVTPGPRDQNNTFDTPFGKFGMFICFDILFYNPSMSTIASGQVKNIIYPTAWFSSLPYYHSLNVQHGYAVVNKVNLLAANLNNVTAGNGGSGIYGANGQVLNYYISGLGSSRLLVAKVGSNDPQAFRSYGLKGFSGFDNKKELESYITPGSFSATGYTVRKIELSNGVELKEKVCQKGFCCEFSITANTSNIPEVYQLVVYDGQGKVIPAVDMLPIRVCALMVCDSRGESCASRDILSSTTFQNISIRAEVKNGKEHFYRPVTLRTQLTPLEPLMYEESTSKDMRTINIRTSNNTDIVLFGIYGRSNGSTIVFSSIFLVIMAAVRTLF
ncbi:unnamed protein product [Callosobruchus maculatus]|uniref:CN hydrolase domain-containing protein n=1 Tax=Callosobruchus maculatus TaxID=64391 RepID=A0A653CUK4_CALMS|nr:unnamed protein product [Callosobruchus maculatus]